MGQPSLDGHRSVDELDRHLQHLGREVPVRESTPPERTAAPGVDPHSNRPDERLEPDRGFDRPRQGPRGPRRHRHAEVLVEDPAELDAGLEEQRLPAGETGRVEGSGSSHRALAAGAGRRTVNGPTR